MLMGYEIRKDLYNQISEKRNRPLISYVTSFRQNASASIASDVIAQFIKCVQNIPNGPEEVDLFIMSYGGDPTVAYRIVTILRERFKKIGALIPYTAYSAATLIALGADEIVMHPFSNLGPVDPQLTHKKDNQTQFSFGSEDLRNYIEFVKNDVGLSDQEQMQRSFEIICKEVGAIPIGIAKRSAQLALSMGEKLLSLHMSDNNKAKTIAETLNKSFFHHGYPLGRTEAKNIGLPVNNAEPEIESLLWKLYESFELDMKFNEPFDPLKIVLNSPLGATLLAPTPQVQLPGNLPPQLLQQAYQQILQQIQITQNQPVDYKTFVASVETSYCRSHFEIEGKIFANRLPDGNISMNLIQSKSGWNYTKNE
jgi:hypothetical protein